MEARDVVTGLGALAQETRLAIFRALAEAGHAGMPAGSLAAALGVLAPTLSFHLQQLAHAGLVVKRRSSRQLIYSVDMTAVNALLGFLTDTCCGGHLELCAPARGPALALSSKFARKIPH